MAEPRYRPGVPDYSGRVPKDIRERSVLGEFCKGMRRRYGASFRPIDNPEQLGLVVKWKGETVDGVIQTAAGPVAVELLGYSPLGDRGDMLGWDFDFRAAVMATFGEWMASSQCWLSFDYRDEVSQVPEAQRPVTKSVVNAKAIQPVLEELRLILAAVPEVPPRTFLSIRFLKNASTRILGLRNGLLTLDAAKFERCSSHFARIRVQGLRSALHPHISSNLSGGGVGLDEQWITAQLYAKLRKSSDSRVRAKELGVWLIVHSDGFAHHQTIAPSHRRRAVNHCRIVLKDHRIAFNRVYWADRTGVSDAAWIGRIL